MRSRTARRSIRVVQYLVLVVIGVFGVAPIAYLVLLSTKRRIDILEVPPSLSVEWDVARENYADVLFERNFADFIVNSTIVTGISVAIALILGVPAAYAFSRYRFRAKERWASTILSFRFMPPVAVAIPILLMIRNVGLTDSKPGLIIPYVAFSLPLVIWIMIGFFDEVPRDIDAAAALDGCGPWGTLVRVLLPLVRPGILVAAIFSSIFIWNEFLVGLYLINSEDQKTIPIGAAGLISAQRPIDWNVAATVGVVTLVPLLIASIFIQKYIVRGITAGAVR
jgi:ABC-type glycerol-3-phosphate transport system permease component